MLFRGDCWSWPLREKDDKVEKKKKKAFQVFLDRKTSALGVIFSCGLTGNSGAAQVSCRSNCQSKKRPVPKPPRLCVVSSTGLQGPTTLKHSLLLHYQRDTIALPDKTPVNSHSILNHMYLQPNVIQLRSWLCVNQMMTACSCGRPARCHSPVANPLPQESGNWFPGPPVGMLLPSSCMAQWQDYPWH